MISTALYCAIPIILHHMKQGHISGKRAEDNKRRPKEFHLQSTASGGEPAVGYNCCATRGCRIFEAADRDNLLEYVQRN